MHLKDLMDVGGEVGEALEEAHGLVAVVARHAHQLPDLREEREIQKQE
jgi:hypothetical protein